MSTNVRHRSRPVLTDDGAPESEIFDDPPYSGYQKNHPLIIKSSYWFLIFMVYFIITLLVLYCDLIRFPDPIPVSDLKNVDKNSRFSEERARNFVVELSSIGSKPTGSYENEVAAVDYLSRQLHYIKTNAKRYNKIEIDFQKTSGCFPLTFKDGMVSCYEDVQNVIAKIGPSINTNKSLIINCHFDSVPTSSGSSDDVVSCAVMLEVLLSLSQLDQPLSNEVIFLFNGAEENILQAAHGFITQHPWAKSAVGFVNMEACGAGGKQMLFQADRERTWLLLAYAKGTPYPQGSVIAQDIFQSGLIPSDTDYRIFEHFGNIPGLDFAYVKNGYVYHTKFDVPEAITAGAIQQAGLNLLNLIYNAIDSPEMTRVEEQTKLQLLFFDFMGIFMVVYRTSIASLINVFVVFLALIDMFWKNRISGISLKVRIVLVSKAFLVLLGTLLCAVLVCLVIATLLNVFQSTMSWYQSPHLIIGLYGCSSTAIIIVMLSLSVTKEKSWRRKWLQEDIYFDAARMLWIVLLLTMELTKLNSSFICCAWVLFPTVIRGIIGYAFSLVGSKATLRTNLVVHISMQLLPLSLLFYCVWSMYNVFVPITGRIGASINPDILVGVFTTLLVFLSTSYMFSLVQVMRSCRNVVAVLSGIFIATFLLVTFTSFGFPYSGEKDSPAPMRLYILHTERSFYNKSGSLTSSDSGYWVVPLDYNGPRMLETFMDNIKEPIDCDAELACGMPFYMPVISLLRLSYYVPASKPKVHGKRKFELISKIQLNSHTYQLTFRTDGPDHQTVIISPRDGVTLSNWSLTKESPLRSLDWVDRPTYFIYYSYGKYKEPWTFSIDLTVTKEYIKDYPLIDVSYITHYLHGHDSMTGDFPSLLKQIPDWVHATPWTCTLDLFIF